MLHHLIQVNYATLILLFLLLVFIITNRYFDKKVRRVFISALVVLLMIVIADSVEYWTASLEKTTVLRIWMSAIGYTLRPAAIFPYSYFVFKTETDELVFAVQPFGNKCSAGFFCIVH